MNYQKTVKGILSVLALLAIIGLNAQPSSKTKYEAKRKTEHIEKIKSLSDYKNIIKREHFERSRYIKNINSLVDSAFNGFNAANIANHLFCLNKTHIERYPDSDDDVMRKKMLSHIFSARNINADDLAELSRNLNIVAKLVYDFAKKNVNDPKNNNKIHPFKIVADTTRSLLAQPQQNKPLIFSCYILKDILSKCLTNVFGNFNQFPNLEDEDSVSETAEINGRRLLLIPNTPIKGDASYLTAITYNKDLIPPYIPYFNKSDLKRIINNKRYIRKDLDADQRDELENFKKEINDVGSEKSPIGDPILDAFLFCSGDEVEAEAEAMKEFIDLDKVPHDLVQYLQYADTEDWLNLDDDEIEELIGNEIKTSIQYSLVTYYLDDEVFKYLVFAIAHEAYHFWFAPYGLTKNKEFDADRFASCVYANLLYDSRLQAVINLEKNIYYGEGIDSTELAEYNSIIGSYKLPNLYEVFKEVCKTEFYETTNTSLYGSIKSRIENMKIEFDKRSDEILKYYRVHYKDSIDSLIKNQ